MTAHKIQTIALWIPLLCGTFLTLSTPSRTMAQTPPSQSDPVMITSIIPEGNRLLIRWEGAVPPYKLQMRTSFTDAWLDVTYHIYANEYRTEPIAGQAYWRVRTIPDKVAPEKPVGVAATAVAQCDRISLRWDALPCADARWCGDSAWGTGLRGYRVYRNGSFVVELTGTSLVDTGLSESTTYSYRIAAVDKAGNESPLSTAASVTTPACVVATGDQTVDLAWDPNPEADLRGYILHVGQQSGNYIDSFDIGNFTTGSIPGLTTGITYYFVVTAYNDTAESDHSNEVVYTVP